MSLSPNLKTTFLYITSLSILSVFVFAILQGWHASKNVERYIQREANLTLEISELEIHLLDLKNSLIQKDRELFIRDQLLEEKNIEITFLGKEIQKWKFLYVKQNEELSPKPEDPLALN